MPSDLMSKIIQLQSQFASEYERIRRRGLEDPGTAGDQGEENWAEFLRGWLPSTYHVVTKGRIIDSKGNSSPQIDIVVLTPAYPRSLLNTKHYVADAVIAAFECKTTLSLNHLAEAFQASSKVKSLVPRRYGTPYKELFNPPFFGLLAHSHSWKGNDEKVRFDLLDRICSKQFNGPSQPWQMLDILCVADLAAFSLHKFIEVGPKLTTEQVNALMEQIGEKEGISTGYFCYWQENPETHRGTVIGQLIHQLVEHCARKDKNLRPISEFYSKTDMVAGGIGKPDFWDLEILSEEVLSTLRSSGTSIDRWDEWNHSL